MAQRISEYKVMGRLFGAVAAVFEGLEDRRLLSVGPGTDAYEPNDSVAQVKADTAGGTNSPNLGTIQGSRTITNLNTVDGSDDWFKFTTIHAMANTDMIKTTSSSSGDIDLFLYADDGSTILNFSANPDANELMSMANEPAGTYYVRVQAYDPNTNYSLTLTVGNGGLGAPQSPFLGTPFTVGETIQAEDFDNGGEGVAYHDTTPTNDGGNNFRNTGVDLQTITAYGGGIEVADAAPGEWLEYTITVPKTGTYNLSARYSVVTSGAILNYSIDGTDATGNVDIPTTGDWNQYQVMTTPVAMTAGTHVLRVSFDGQAGNAGFAGNFDWFKLAYASATPPPSNPSPTPTESPFKQTYNVGDVIQAEDFNNGGEGVAYHDTTGGNTGLQYRLTDVDIESTGDTGGGYDVGWTKAGEWMDYTVNVATAGTYTVNARVASPAAGATFEVDSDGVDATGGAISIPDTGSFQNWVTVSHAITLTAGQHELRFKFDANASNGFAGNVNWIQLVAPGVTPPGPETPFHGTPFTVGQVIQAEDFNNGGEGVAYKDTTPGNEFNTSYRTSDVDIQTTTDSGGGYAVGGTAAGEWLDYTVNVATTGAYNLALRVATLGGGTMHVNVDGVNMGSIAVPSTGSFAAWDTITKALNLTAGTHVLRLFIDAGDSAGYGPNVNWLQLTAQGGTTPPTGPETPFHGTAFNVGDTIQAEDFNNGGEGVAYKDTTPGNEFKTTYRTSDVDIEATTDAGGGYDVGGTAAGEWLDYSVNVATAGTYTLSLRVASNGGGVMHVNDNGVNTGAIGIPNTGSFSAWTTVTKSLTMTAGAHVLRLFIDAGDSAGFGPNVNWLKLTAAGGTTTTPPVTGESPFHGTAFTTGERIGAEDFDNGGEGVSYHDTTPGNAFPTTYRTSDVDIEATTDVDGNFDVADTAVGEWLNYTVNVATSGTYNLLARVSSNGGGVMHVNVDGVNTGSIAVPNTGSFTKWTTISHAVTLTAGTHILRLNIDAVNSLGYGPDLNWMELTT